MSEGEEAAATPDLRILTPGLGPEEIAAVTSVVTAMLAEQQAAAERHATAEPPRWRHAVEPFGRAARGAGAWQRSLR